MAHALLGVIAELRDRFIVDILQLDDDIQRIDVGIVGAEGTDAEADLCSAFEVVVKLLCAVKVQAIGEQQELGTRIDAVALVVLNDLFAPFIRIAGVMANAVVVVDHRTVEVHKEEVGGDGVGEGGTVITVILVIPVAHRVVVGVGERVTVDALIHLHKLMRIGADGGEVVLHREIDVGGTGAALCFGRKPADNNVLPFAGESAAAAELCKGKGIGAVVQRFDLFVQLFFCRFQERIIIVRHAEVNFVDDLQEMDLELHRGEQRTFDNDGELAAFTQRCCDILPDGMPQTEKFYIVVFDEADGTQIVELILAESQGTEMVDLGVDLLEHFGCELHILVTAFKVVFSAQIGMFMEDDLIHIEFIQVGVE